jgi:hypothetical protein
VVSIKYAVYNNRFSKKIKPGEKEEILTFMQLSNLDNRLLLLLARKWKERGTGGPYRTSMIYKNYAELPDDYITGELNKWSAKGLITFTFDRNRFYLADKGVSKIQSFISTDRWNSVGI